MRSMLREISGYTLSVRLNCLKYRLIGEDGPDHDKRFYMEVALDGVPVGNGSGRSKKEAEQMSAKAAIELLSK